LVEEDDDELSEPDIASAYQRSHLTKKQSDGTKIVTKQVSSSANESALAKPALDSNTPAESRSVARRRQLKELAKFHARDIIAFKVNKKLAEQAAIAQQNAAQ
jgi:hypothetical protein